ncbi:hypothetical protein [Metamycoplasma alkalescens]|uniref:Lipoprotein n=2 Tax=Metamycoplasma alkalescens TaxID=45363 RepID=N9UAW5_9BACT
MKKSKFLFIPTIITPMLSLFALSCNNPNNNSNNNNNNRNNFDTKIDYTIVPNNPSKLLTDSQIQQVHNSFSFKTTSEGAKKTFAELKEIVKKIRNDVYPSNKEDFDRIPREQTFNGVLQHPDFKKYFNFEYPNSRTFGFLSGHKFELELVEEGSKRKSPAIHYVLLCPDKIQNGKMSQEAYGDIYLDNNIW